MHILGFSAQRQYTHLSNCENRQVIIHGYMTMEHAQGTHTLNCSKILELYISSAYIEDLRMSILSFRQGRDFFPFMWKICMIMFTFFPQKILAV